MRKILLFLIVTLSYSCSDKKNNESSSALKQEISKDSIFSKYVGKYKIVHNPTDFVVITSKDGKLYGKATNRQKVQLYPESEAHLFNVPDFNVKVKFVLDSLQKFSSILILDSGQQVVGKKVLE